MVRLYLLPVFALLALSPGCDEESSGRVELRFSLPEDDALSPIVGLAEISVVARSPGAEPRIQTVRVDNGRSEIVVGQLAPDSSGVEISVELRASNQRLIGYGRSPGLVAISSTDDTIVDIELRRPFAYLTGGEGVIAFDGTVDLNSPDYRDRIGNPTPATAVATSAGGDLILVASASATGGTLRAIATRDHEAVPGIAVSLARPPSSIAVSPDDEYVVVTHETTAAGTGGVSIARLAAVVASETPSAEFIELGNVGDVAIALGPTPGASPVAMLLLDASRDCEGDAPASSIVGLDLAEPDGPRVTVTPGRPIPDLTVDAPTQTLLFASPCTDQVLSVLPLVRPNEFTEVQVVEGVSVVATRDGQVVGVGTSPYEEFPDPTSPDPMGKIRIGASLLIGRSALDGSDAGILKLASSEERAVALGVFENRLPAEDLVAYDLAISPGGDLVAILTRSVNIGIKRVLTDNGQRRPFIPRTELVSYEYRLVDLAAGTSSQRVRTQCDLSVVLNDEIFGYALPDWECATSADQDTLDPTESFVPVHVTTLYGAR